MADIPQSIVSELADWNDGAGIDLVDWTANTGSFSLAVGYSEVFWPRFTEFENYVLMESFSLAALRSFESLPQITRQSIERVMNHLHIADIQHGACTDIAADKLIFLGHRLREIYAAKLALDFPDRKFLVEFYCPEQSQDFEDYQFSFFPAVMDSFRFQLDKPCRFRIRTCWRASPDQRGIASQKCASVRSPLTPPPAPSPESRPC